MKYCTCSRNTTFFFLQGNIFTFKLYHEPFRRVIHLAHCRFCVRMHLTFLLVQFLCMWHTHTFLLFFEWDVLYIIALFFHVIVQRRPFSLPSEITPTFHKSGEYSLRHDIQQVISYITFPQMVIKEIVNMAGDCLWEWFCDFVQTNSTWYLDS